MPREAPVSVNKVISVCMPAKQPLLEEREGFNRIITDKAKNYP